MKVTITSIFKKERISQAGKPFTSMSIKTQEHGDKWLGGFLSEGNKDWVVGDTVDIEISTKGDYLNYSLPKSENRPSQSQSPESIARLTNLIEFGTIGRLDKLEAKIDVIYKHVKNIAADDIPGDEINLADTPF